MRLRGFRGLLGFAAAIALTLGLDAHAAWPPPPDATAEQLADPAQWPNDPDFGSQWWLFGFTPSPATSNLPERERTLGVGMRVDAAFSLTRGDPRVHLALAGSGARWEHPDLLTRWGLSRGELPPPQAPDGSTSMGADPHDLNSDGRFDVRDFTDAAPGELPSVDRIADPRLRARADLGDANSNGVLDPQDLVRAFSNGVDEDGNGFTDDVCGWDFVDGDNDPEDPSAAATGTRAAELAGAEANNARGGVGACPECSLVPLRVATGPKVLPRRVRETLGFTSPAPVAGGAWVLAVLGAPTHRDLATETALSTPHASRLIVVPASDDPEASAWPEAPAVLRVTRLGWAGPSATTALATSEGCRGELGGVELSASGPSCAEATAAAAGTLALGWSGVLATSAGAVDAQTMAELARSATTPVHEGRRFDPQTGFGRLDAGALVTAQVAQPSPPPLTIAPPTRARVPSPSFEVRVEPPPSGVTVKLFAARGTAPDDASFIELSTLVGPGGEVTATVELPALSGMGLTTQTELSAVTLRFVTAWGSPARTRELRRLVFAHDQRELPPGFPLRVPAASTPVRLGDFDGDGEEELYFGGADGRIHVLRASGAPLKGFPVQVAEGEEALMAPPAFADLDGNSTRELIAVTREGTLALIETSGAVVFRKSLGAEVLGAPAVASTPSGARVVVVTGDGILHVLRDNGTPSASSPLELPLERVAAAVAVADVTGDDFPEVAVVGEAQGRARAVVVSATNDELSLLPGWPVDLGPVDRGLHGEQEPAPIPPVIGDFDRANAPELVFRVRGQHPVVLKPSGEPALELRLDGVPQGPLLATALTDFGRNRRLELLSSEGGSLSLWRVGNQLALNEELADAPAPYVNGFPVPFAPHPLTSVAVADVTGDDLEDLLVSSDRAVRVIDDRGETALGWPRFVGDALQGGPALGVQIGSMMVGALTRDGWLYAWTVSGFPNRIQWDGFQHDPAHTGSFATPLPDREISSIGLENPPEIPSGCCTGAPGPLEASALGGLLLLLRARGRRRMARGSSPRADGMR